MAPPTGATASAINSLSAAMRKNAQSNRSKPRSASETEKLQALAAAFAGTSATAAAGATPLDSAKARLYNSIANINNSDAPASAKKKATDQADTSKDNESFLTRALNVLGKPKTAVVAGISRLVDDERNFLKDLENNVGVADVLAKADWFKDLPTPAKIAVGITGDIALDPLTYLMGSGVITKAGSVTGIADKLTDVARTAEKAGDLATAKRATELGGNLLRKGQGGIGGVSNADLKWIGEVTGVADEVGRSMKGGLYFQPPMTGRVANYASKKLGLGGINSAKYQIYLGRGPLVQGVSKRVANATMGAKTSSFMREIGDKYGGSSGKIKRAILEADSPEEALRRRATFRGMQAGEGAASAVIANLDKQYTTLYKAADRRGVAGLLGGVLDGNVDDIAAVDAALGTIVSPRTGELVPFSVRLREFDEDVVRVAEDQIKRIASHRGVDPESVGSLLTLRDGHFKGVLTDEAREALDKLSKLNKTKQPVSGLEGSQIRSAYTEGQEFLGVPIASPNRDIAHVTAEVGGRRVVIQPKNGEFGSTVDEAMGSIDGFAIQNNEMAAGAYLRSPAVKAELDAARRAVKAAQSPAEREAAKAALQQLKDRLRQESMSLMNVRVQVDGKQQWMIIPMSRMEAKVLPQSRFGPRTQVNQISRQVNGFDFFDMDWGNVGTRQIGEIGNAVRAEVLGVDLKRYGSLGGLAYAADLDVPESTMKAQAAIAKAVDELGEAEALVAAAQSETLARRFEAMQFAVQNADDIRTARDELLAIVKREGKLSSTPKRKQLAALEVELEDAMNQLDVERAAFAKATENLKGLQDDLKVAQANYAAAADDASRARAEAELRQVEDAIDDGVEEISNPEFSVEPAVPEIDPMIQARADFDLATGLAARQLDEFEAATPAGNLDELQAELVQLRRERAPLFPEERKARIAELQTEIRALQEGTAQSAEAIQARRILEARDLVAAEPDAIRNADDFQRLLDEARTPAGNVRKVFDDIKAENARGFTDDMKAAVADATTDIADDVDARTALRNPEMVAGEGGVDAVVAASKVKQEAAGAFPATPAAGPSILEVPEDELVLHWQGRIDEIKADIARQKQYGTKNRKSRVANREAQVAELEQDWIVLDEKIRALDVAFVEETARRGVAAREQWTPLMEQIQRVKESIRVAKDAELQAMRVFDRVSAKTDFTVFMRSPQAQQEFRTAVLRGWTRLSRNTQIPDDVAEVMAMWTRVMGPDELPSVFRAFDKLTTLFKKWAIASPGFISRNMFGGFFNNYLGGVDAGRYTEFLRADYQFWKARRGGVPIDKAFDAIKDPTVRKGYRMLHDSGVLAETDQVMDAVYGMNRALGRGTSRGVNDIGVLSDNPFTRAVYKGNHRAERVLRGAAGLDAAIKSNSLDQVYETVFKLHFNYADLNRFEVNVMKRISPFYAWTRFNLPLQMEMILRNPKAYSHYNIFAHNINAASDPEDIVPSWMRDRMAIRLPFSTDGGNMYVLPDLPLNSLQLIGNLDELGGQINPVIKTPIEMALDRKLYFGSSAPFREGYVQFPAAYKLLAPAMEAAGFAVRDANGNLMARDKHLYAIEQFMPFFGRARRLLPDEEKYQDRLPTTVINFLFGAGLRTNTDADKRGEILYRQQVVDQIAKDLKSLNWGGYEQWTKQVAVSRKPTEQDKRPYLSLLEPKGGLPNDTPYTSVPSKPSVGEMLAALRAAEQQGGRVR